MYYISNQDSNLGLSQMKKRLADFKGIEGEKYHVRKKPGRPEGIYHVPIYIYQDGKLRRTGELSVYGLI